MTNTESVVGYELISDELCRSFQRHLEIVGQRWNSAILLAGARGARRFSEYRRLIEGISDRLLTQRLKELEAEGFVTRTVIATTPVSIRYELTAKARELMAILEPLVTWELKQDPSLTNNKLLTSRLHVVGDRAMLEE